MSHWLLIMFAMFCVLGAIACEDKPTVELEKPETTEKEEPAKESPKAEKAKEKAKAK